MAVATAVQLPAVSKQLRPDPREPDPREPVCNPACLKYHRPQVRSSIKLPSLLGLAAAFVVQAIHYFVGNHRRRRSPTACASATAFASSELVRNKRGLFHSSSNRAFPHAPRKLSTVPLQHTDAQPSKPPVGGTSKGSSAWPWITPVRKIIAYLSKTQRSRFQRQYRATYRPARTQAPTPSDRHPQSWR